MLLTPLAKIAELEERIKDYHRRIDSFVLRSQIQTTTNLLLQRELSYAHAALRRKNKQLKQLKALVELHKEYVKLHPPETAR